MSCVYSSSAICAKDSVRLPSSVNDLGEYLASISDLLRENGGNKIAAYSLSSLEQYIPLFLMETARIIASGNGLPSGFKITLNGVESLDRSCSVLYRDLKGATSFENSFWDDEVAADAFERAASYVGLMELDMDEVSYLDYFLVALIFSLFTILSHICNNVSPSQLVTSFRNKGNEFTPDDYKIMFSMNGPRRKGKLISYSELSPIILNT